MKSGKGLQRSRLRSDSFSSVHSAIDWLSCSAERGDAGDALYRRGSVLLAAEVASGNREKPWKLKSLSGSIAGSVVRAVSGTHVYVQVSGERAATAAYELIPFASNVSRLDLQLTAEGLPGALPDVARWAYKARAVRRRGGRPPERRLTLSSQGGSTCYCGSPSSDVLGRVYDKGAEQGWAVPGTIWRWEVQLRREVADLTARELLQVESLEAEVAARVRTRFTEWGCDVPLGPLAPHHLLPRKERNDSARLLDWLRIAVSPTVRFLCGTVGVDKTREALGLPPTSDSSR